MKNKIFLGGVKGVRGVKGVKGVKTIAFVDLKLNIKH